jgi:hypothetical protein
MKKSEGFYLIRDNRLRRLERQTLETLIQFVKFVKKQVRSTWRRRSQIGWLATMVRTPHEGCDVYRICGVCLHT